MRFQGTEPQAVLIPPLFRVQVGETARISGMLHAVSDKGVALSVPWQAAEIVVARPGAQAILQRPGEARLFADRFERISESRWSVSGKPELLDSSEASNQGRRVKLPAGESSLQHRLADPLGSGRVELSLFDEGKVAPGQRWTLDLTFRGPTGPATVRVLLGWAEESLAVESPDGPALAVQRLRDLPGWHRLTIRFGPEQTEIAVDGKELAHGKSPSGPLDAIRIATSGAGSSPATPSPPPGLAGYLGEIRIVRFAEPPTSLEIDPTQDEVRLVVGDQLYGHIRQADHEHVVIETADKRITLDWSEVAGIYFRRIPAAATPVEGTLARLEWRTMPGEPNQARDLDHAEGAITTVSDSAIALATSYAGTLTIPRDRLVRLRVLDRGWLRVIDPSATIWETTSRPRRPCSTRRCPREECSNAASSSRPFDPGKPSWSLTFCRWLVKRRARPIPTSFKRVSCEPTLLSTASESTTSITLSRRPTRRPSESGSRFPRAS